VLANQARQVLREQEAAIRSLDSAIKGTNLSSFGAMTGAASLKLEDFSKTLTRNGDALIKWGKNAQWTGRQLQFAFTLPVLAAIGAGTHFFLQQEKQLTELRKVYQVFGDGTRDLAAELKILDATATSLSNAWGVNRAEVAKVMSGFAEAGISGVALQKMTDLAIQTSIVSATDLETVTKNLISVQAIYGGSVDDTRKRLEKLNIIQTVTGITFAGLIDIITKAGSTAETAGSSFEELAAFGSALVPATGSATSAGNALRTILIRVVAPVTAGKKAFKELGIAIDSMGWKAKTGTERLKDIADRLKHFSPDAQIRIVKDIFGVFQANRALTLLKDIGDANGNVARSMKEVNAEGKATKLWTDQLAEVMRSDPKKFQQFWVMLQNALARIVIPMIPLLGKLVGGIVQLVTWFASLDENTLKWVLGLALALAALGPVIKYVGAFSTLLGVLFKIAGFVILRIAELLGISTKRAAAAAAAAAQERAAALEAKRLALELEELELRKAQRSAREAARIERDLAAATAAEQKKAEAAAASAAAAEEAWAQANATMAAADRANFVNFINMQSQKTAAARAAAASVVTTPLALGPGLMFDQSVATNARRVMTETEEIFAMSINQIVGDWNIGVAAIEGRLRELGTTSSTTATVVTRVWVAGAAESTAAWNQFFAGTEAAFAQLRSTFVGFPTFFEAISGEVILQFNNMAIAALAFTARVGQAFQQLELIAANTTVTMSTDFTRMGTVWVGAVEGMYPVYLDTMQAIVGAQQVAGEQISAVFLQIELNAAAAIDRIAERWILAIEMMKREVASSGNVWVVTSEGIEVEMANTAEAAQLSAAKVTEAETLAASTSLERWREAYTFINEEAAKSATFQSEQAARAAGAQAAASAEAAASAAAAQAAMREGAAVTATETAEMSAASTGNIVLMIAALAPLIIMYFVKYKEQVAKFLYWVAGQVMNLAKLIQYIFTFGAMGHSPKAWLEFKVDYSDIEKAKKAAQDLKDQESYRKMTTPPSSAKDAAEYTDYVRKTQARKADPIPYKDWHRQRMKMLEEERKKQEQLANENRKRGGGKVGGGGGGAADELTPKQLAKQREIMEKNAATIAAYLSLLPDLDSALSNTSMTVEQQARAIQNWKEKLDEANKAIERSKERKELLEVAPQAVPALDGIIAKLDELRPKLDAAREAYYQQDLVVIGLKKSLDDANRALDEQQRIYDTMKLKSDALKEALDQQKQVLDNLYDTPLEGLKEMDDQIFANEMAQKRLRLELLKMKEADKSIEDVSNRLAELHGDLTVARGRFEDLRESGAGSEILGPLGAEMEGIRRTIAGMEGQGGGVLEGPMSAVQKLEEELKNLQDEAERLDLEKSLRFDPLKRKIDETKDSMTALPFDELYSKILGQKQVVADLQAQWELANQATEGQKKHVDELVAARDIIKTKYDEESAKLEVLKGNYESLKSVITDVEGTLSNLVTTIQNNKTALDSMAQTGVDGADQIGNAWDALFEGGEDKMNDWLAQFNADMDLAEQKGLNFNPFAGLGEKLSTALDDLQKKLTDWIGIGLVTIVAPIAVALGAIPTAVGAAIVGAILIIKNHWRGLVQGIINVGNFLIEAINAMMDTIGVPSKIGNQSLRFGRIPDLPKEETEGGGGGGGRPPLATQLHASGAVMGRWEALVASGAIPSVQVRDGFITNKPRAIVGEGSNVHPEYVIPTDPKYRARATALYNDLGPRLMEDGGISGLLGKIPGVGPVLEKLGDFEKSAKRKILSTAFDVATKPIEVTPAYRNLPGLGQQVYHGIKNRIRDGLVAVADVLISGPLPGAYNGAIIRGSAEGTILRAGERGRDEAIIPLQSGDEFNRKEMHFHGDLSFPNITDPNDAEAFVRNLESLAGR